MREEGKNRAWTPAVTAALLAAAWLSNGCAMLSVRQTETLKQLEDTPYYAQERDEGTAFILGLLPIAGGAYAGDAGLALTSIFWPYSIIWHPVGAMKAARKRNYDATMRRARRAYERELGQLRLRGQAIPPNVAALEEMRLRERFSFLFTPEAPVGGDYQDPPPPGPPGFGQVPPPLSADAAALDAASVGQDGAEGEEEDQVQPEMVFSRYPDFRHKGPENAGAGQALVLDAYAPAEYSDPVLMLRKAGEWRYQPYPFTAELDGYYTVSVPAMEIRPPYVQYYLTARKGKGPGRVVVSGDPLEPGTIGVGGGINESIELERYGSRGMVSAFYERAEIPQDGKFGSDYWQRIEAEYLYRVFRRFFSFRYGEGYLSGRGRHRVNDGWEWEETGLLYTYLELEARSSRDPRALIFRALGGVTKGRTASGGGLRLRLGDELDVNLLVGVDLYEKLGYSALMEFNVWPGSRTRLTLATALENLPLGAEMEFRSWGQVRWHLARTLALNLRLGVAARDTFRIGYNAGTGLSVGF